MLRKRQATYLTFSTCYDRIWVFCGNLVLSCGSEVVWNFAVSKGCTISSSPLRVQSLLSHPSPVQCGSILNNLLRLRNLQFFNFEFRRCMGLCAEFRNFEGVRASSPGFEFIFVISKAWGRCGWNFDFRVRGGLAV